MTEGGMLVEEGAPFKPDQKMREHLEKAEIEVSLKMSSQKTLAFRIVENMSRLFLGHLFGT